MEGCGAFFKLVSEFGGLAQEKEDDGDLKPREVKAAQANAMAKLTRKHVGTAAGTGKLEVCFSLGHS
jgi:hypothetical protein